MGLMDKHFEVEPPLSDIVKHFYVIQTSADFEETIAHLSPNFEMMMIFNFSTAFKISYAAEPATEQVDRITILGPLKKMLNYQLLPDTDLLTIVFNLDGFYRLFQVTPDEILVPDTFISDLWPILKRATPEERVQILSDYILSTTHAPEEGSIPLLEHAAYFNDPLIKPGKAIADDTNLSERTIQLRFKKYVGYSPKEMLRFLRFKQVINSIEQSSNHEIDWFDLIHDFGYHDQTHLIKDFNHFLGITPQTFIKQYFGKDFCTNKSGKRY